MLIKALEVKAEALQGWERGNRERNNYRAFQRFQREALDNHRQQEHVSKTQSSFNVIKMAKDSFPKLLL